MDRLDPISIGIALRDGVAYSFSSLTEKLPLMLQHSFDWLHANGLPFVVNNSLFLFMGVLGFAAVSSTMHVSSAMMNSRRELFRLASESRISGDLDAIDENEQSVKKALPKKYENIFVFTNSRLSKKKLHQQLDSLCVECGLDKPHFSLDELVRSIKTLFYHISFHDHSEFEIKQLLLDNGWNFNLLNQAFTVIEMELCNEIAGAYANLSQYEISEAMRSVKELALKGYTQKKIEKYLLEHGNDKSHLNKVFKNIYKVQTLHTKIKRSQERRIKRALRLNASHPQKYTHGNINS